MADQLKPVAASWFFDFASWGQRGLGSTGLGSAWFGQCAIVQTYISDHPQHIPAVVIRLQQLHPNPFDV